MGKRDPQLSDDTVLVRDERHSEGSIAPPIYQTSLFAFESYQSMVDRFRGTSQSAALLPGGITRRYRSCWTRCANSKMVKARSHSRAGSPQLATQSSGWFNPATGSCA